MNTIFYYLFGSTPVSKFWTDLGWATWRVVLGLSLAFGHGLSKIPPADGFINGLANAGLPFPTLMAWLCIFAEFVCALLLALGLITRFAAFVVVINMAVAVFVFHAGDDFAVREPAVLYLFGTVPFLIGGAGSISFDRLLKRT